MHSISEIGSNVPAFLGKLWKMVEDPMTNDLISWCPRNDSFVIKDATRLARELLPMYYKHNNMASFIRQLNMYGFHKIVSSDCKQEVEEMKFTHPNFIRGHPYLLEKIKRKITIARGPEKPNSMNKMLNDVRQIKGKQDTMESRLSAMKRENEALWRELSLMRQKHKKQQHIVNKLIHYLVLLIQNHHLPVTRRGFPLMLKDKAAGHRHSSGDQQSKSPSGPVIHELDPADVLLDDVDSSAAEPTISSTESSPELFSPEEVDISNEILNSSDVVEAADPPIEIIVDEFPDHFLTDKTIPAEIQNLAAMSNEQGESNETISVARKTQPKTNKRLNRTAIKIPAKKQKKEATTQPIHYVISNTDANVEYIVPEMFIPSENETVSPAENLDIPASPEQLDNCTPVQLEASASPLIVTADWSSSSPSPISPSKDKLISTPIVESILSSPPSTEAPAVIVVPDVALDDLSAISDADCNNMQVARMESGKNPNIVDRFGHFDEMDDHVESVQADLDSFKELLRSEGISLDANALLGFLNEENLSSVISNNSEDSMNAMCKKEAEGNELMMYSPSIFDLSDIISGNDWNLPDTDNTQLAPEDDVFKEVNTPQFIPNSPSFPVPSKTRKK